MPDPTEAAAEPPDHHQYYLVNFFRPTATFLRDAARFAIDLITRDLKAIDDNPALRGLLSPDDRENLPVERLRYILEQCYAAFVEAIGEPQTPEDTDRDRSYRHSCEMDVTHGEVRLLKSAALLYLRHLWAERNALASRPDLSRYVLQAVDKAIAEREETLEKGVFRGATPLPLLVDELSLPAASLPQPAPAAGPLSVGARPLPIILDIPETIEILDPELRERCLDLLGQFRAAGDLHRLDTVVREATTLLEDRLRDRFGGTTNEYGTGLAGVAFGGKSPRLVLSSVAAEQEGGQALFRGVFGFIRNPVGHKLVADVRPERALQIIAMVDYLLHVIDTATVAGGPLPPVGNPTP